MEIIFDNQDSETPLVDEAKLIEVLNYGAQYVTQEYDVSSHQKLNICFFSPEQMEGLNVEFVKHQGTTDVITFDYRDELEDGEEDDYIGEIYVCPFVAIQRAEEFGNTFINELVLYAMHGMLHLFGYDDKTSDDQIDMTKAERRVMKHILDKYSLDGIYAL